MISVSTSNYTTAALAAARQAARFGLSPDGTQVGTVQMPGGSAASASPAYGRAGAGRIVDIQV